MAFRTPDAQQRAPAGNKAGSLRIKKRTRLHHVESAIARRHHLAPKCVVQAPHLATWHEAAAARFVKQLA